MRSEKQLLLDEIKDKLNASTALVVTRYQALNPNMAAQLRNHLAKSGGGFTVLKKRILMKAAEGGGLNLNREMLPGHIGLAFAYRDPIEMTKAFFQFSKEHESVFEVLGGRFDGNFYTAKDVETIAKLPGQTEMRAQFLGLLEAPMSQTIAVVESLLTSLLYCFENKANKE